LNAKLLLICVQRHSTVRPLHGRCFDYVFSLNDRVSIGKIRRLFSAEAVVKEEELGQLLFSLYSEVRELLVDFVAQWGNMPITASGENFKSLFQWNGMSLWWMSNLVRKDPGVESQFFYRLCYLFFVDRLLQEGRYEISLLTDDKYLMVAFKTNFPNVTVYYHAENPLVSMQQWVSHKVRAFGHIVLDFLQLEFFKRIIGPGQFREVLGEGVSFFATLYPVNFREENGVLVDRHFSDLPLSDEKFGKRAVYLVSCYFPWKELLSLRKVKKELGDLARKVKRPVIFLDYFIRRRDLFKIHCNWRHKLLFWRLKKTILFKNSFRMGGLDVSAILARELSESFNGSFQLCEKHGISFQRFFQSLPGQRMVVTYGELLTRTRAVAHCIKKAHPDNQLISIQHAMNCRNKMNFYHRRSEFAQDGQWDAVQFSPMPDNYLIQGNHFKEILRGYYPEKRIRTIGCVKYGTLFKGLTRLEEMRDKCRSVLNISDSKTLILLAPSTSDVDSIFRILDGLKGSNRYRVLLSPHPVMRITEMQKRQEELGIDVRIEYIEGLQTWELLTVVDLVICGFSTVALEAAIFGVPAVRAVSYKELPLFDQEPEIPCFHDSDAFSKWLHENQINEEGGISQLVQRYFYKVDGQADVRLWQSIISFQG